MKQQVDKRLDVLCIDETILIDVRQEWITVRVFDQVLAAVKECQNKRLDIKSVDRSVSVQIAEIEPSRQPDVINPIDIELGTIVMHALDSDSQLGNVAQQG